MYILTNSYIKEVFTSRLRLIYVPPVNISLHGKTILPDPFWRELDSGSYIRSLDRLDVKDKIRSLLKEALCYEGLITQKQLEWLYGFAFSSGRRIRHNPNGTIFISGNLKQCYEYLKPVIDQLLPDASLSPVVDGNFFITPSQYGLHTDSLRKEDFESNLEKTPADHPRREWVPWRNIIIPLWVSPPESVSHICFFKQRHIDWAHVYNHGNLTPNIASTYPIITNMADVQFYDEKGQAIHRKDNLLAYQDDHFKSFFQTPDGKNLTPKRRLTGLVEEKTFVWQPGNAMVFDSCQLHATNNGANMGHPWTLKMGLLLKFIHKI